MRTTKELNKKNTGSDAFGHSFSKNGRQNKGITLIALVITIIVMLVLVAVTISMAVNGGLFDYAGKAVGETEGALKKEQILTSGKIEVGGVWYNNIDDYLNNKEGTPPFDVEEWDKKAAPENVFIWQSDDPNDEGYRIIIGFKQNIQNYTSLRIPSRCIKIIDDASYEIDSQIRSYTKNIKEIELPNTVQEIGYGAFGNVNPFDGYDFSVLEKIIIPNSVTTIGDYAFSRSGLSELTIPNNVVHLGTNVFSRV